MYSIFIILISILLLLGLIRILSIFKDNIKFYISGFDSGFKPFQISLLWKLAKSSQLTDPTALFWSVPVLDKTITQLIAAEKMKGTLSSAAFQTFLSKLYQFRTKIELNSGKKGLESTKNLDSGQQIRIILRGSGVFSSKIAAVSRDLVISLPKKDGRILISGVDWIGKTISLYFWRKNDAAYVFDTVVKESGMYNGENVLYLAHTSELLRTQKRRSIRCACHMYAQMYVVRSETADLSLVETEPGLKCLLEDISEDGALIRIGGKGVKNMKIKLQFTIADSFIVMAGLVRGVDYDDEKKQSLLHFECTQISPPMKNAVLSYVYNVLPQEEKDVIDAIKLAEEDGSVMESGDENLPGGENQ
ncbi:MAG: PilZ domain-containing protein [Spirochaetaceae bacterium]|nr:PilZ domain-containing protein [Spirochaetaceae bacterium]